MQIKIKSLEPAALFLSALVLLFAIPFSRGLIGKPFLYGQQTYHSLASGSQSFYSSLLKLPGNNPLMFQLCLGLGFLVGLYLLIRVLSAGLESYAVLFAMFSPGTLHVFSNLLADGLALFCLVWGIFFFFKQRPFISTLFLLMGFAASPWYMLGGLVLIWVYFIIKQRSLQFPVFMSLAALVIFLLLDFRIEISQLATTQVITNLVFELGGPSGFSLITLLLAVIGFFATYKAFKELATVYVYSALAFIGMYLFGTSPLVFLFIIPVLAAYTIQLLLKRKWVLQSLKYITLLLIVLGVVLSASFSIVWAVSQSPDKEMELALAELAKLPVGNVLSSPAYGAFISYGAQKPIVADSLVSDAILLNETETIFASRDLKKARVFFLAHNVSYLFISPEMRSGLVWNEPEEGLLFLLRNNQTFAKEYTYKGFEIWKIKNP